MGCGHGSPEPAPFHKQYALCAKLGSGNFGQVWEIRKKSKHESGSPKVPAGFSSTQETYAVKICDLREEVDGDLYVSKYLVSAAQRELEIWRLLGPHGNCVQLLQSFMEDHLCYMIMEKCGCTILHKFEEKLAATEEDLSACARQMLQGISHVHSAKIVHRDVKPENFLFVDRTFKTVKLCDFGLAKKLPRRGVFYVRCGTAPYMSPEMVNDIGYAEKTDVWSCGATVYLLLCGDLPYVVPGSFDKEKTIEAIRSGSPQIPFARNPEYNFPPPSDCAIELTKALLDRSPSTRCSAIQALQLPFVSNAPALELEAPLSPVVKCARRKIRAFAQPVDPTKQRTLDEILAILQEEYGGQVSIKRAFSEPMTPNLTPSDENVNENSEFARQITDESQRSQRSQKLPLIERHKSRHSTFSGPVLKAAGDGLTRSVSPESASEQSTGSGTTPKPFPMKVSL